MKKKIVLALFILLCVPVVVLGFQNRGDANNDGTVNLFDYNILLSQYGQQGQQLGADFNVDNIVNLFDYNTLISFYGQLLPSPTISIIPSISPSGGPVSIFRELYVSPSGNDSNNGTVSQPLRTITKAQEIVRSIRGGMTGDIKVILRGGTYEINAPISFTSNDSGKDSHMVRYEAYPGEVPVLSGGKAITNWQPYTALANVYIADVPDAIKFRQLYWNNEPLPRSRHPNNLQQAPRLVSPDISGVDQRFILNTARSPEEVISVYRLLDQSNLQNAEIVIPQYWDTSKLQLRSIQTEAGVMKISVETTQAFIEWCKNRLWDGAYPSCLQAIDLSYVGPAQYANQPIYLENSAFFLDSPGEWYFDKLAGKIYLYAPTGVTTVNQLNTNPPIVPRGSVIGQNEQMITLFGTATAPVKNIEFRGIQISHTNWLNPTFNGHVAWGPSYYRTQGSNGKWIVNKIPASVSLRYAHNIRFQQNNFTNLGGTAMLLEHGVQNFLFAGNTVKNTVSSGIMMDRYQADFKVPANYIQGVSIIGNTFENIGITDGLAGSAIYTVGKDMIVRSNTLKNISHSGILVSGLSNFEVEESLGNVLVETNTIERVVTHYGDAAGIYIAHNQPNVVIRNNRIDTSPELPFLLPGEYPRRTAIGLYLDAGATGVNITGNVVKNFPIAFNQNCEYGNFITNNVVEGSCFDRRSITFGGCFYPDGDIVHNISCPRPTYTARERELKDRFFPTCESFTSTTRFENNVISDACPDR
jgi:hypothetical protein